MCAILHHLEYTTEAAFCIAHSKVNDVDKYFWLINPELGFILFATTEFLYDFLNDVYTLTWVAVRHLSSDNILRSWEDTMVGI